MFDTAEIVLCHDSKQSVNLSKVNLLFLVKTALH